MIRYNKGVALKAMGKTRLTRKEFQKQTGLARQQLMNLLASGNPSIGTLCKIANGMGVKDMNIFFRGGENERVSCEECSGLTDNRANV